MRITHVISSMTVDAGGPPVICAGIACAQAAAGHHVTIAAVDHPGKDLVAIHDPVQLKIFPLVGKEPYCNSPELDAWANAHLKEADCVHLHSVWQFPTFAAADYLDDPKALARDGANGPNLVQYRCTW